MQESIKLYPARVKDKTFKVSESTVGGCTAYAPDGSGKVLEVSVPSENSPYARTVRRHEALHALYSDGTVKCDSMVLQAIEDAKVHAIWSKATGAVREDEVITAVTDIQNHKAGKDDLTALIAFRSAAMLGRETLRRSPEVDSDLRKLCEAISPEYYEKIWAGLENVIEGRYSAAEKILSEYFRGDSPKDEGFGHKGDKVREVKISDCGTGVESGEKSESKPDSESKRSTGSKSESGSTKTYSKSDKLSESKPDTGKPESTETKDEPSESEAKTGAPKASGTDSKETPSKPEPFTEDSEPTERCDEDGYESSDLSDDPEESESGEDTEDSESDSEDSEDTEDGEDSESSEDTEDSETGEDSETLEPVDPVSYILSKDSCEDRLESAPVPTIKLPRTLTPLAKALTESKGLTFNSVPQMFIHRLDYVDNIPTVSGEQISTSRSGTVIRSNKLVSAVTGAKNVHLFKKKQFAKGGSILIDASGSMAISDKDLLDLLLIAPMASIAFYNAISDDSDAVGNLWIFAENGRRAKDLSRVDREPHKSTGKLDPYGRPEYKTNPYHFGMGNVVDASAMQWLLEQPGPRYYVTDREWTGGYENARLCNTLLGAARRRNLLTVVWPFYKMSGILRGSK